MLPASLVVVVLAFECGFVEWVVVGVGRVARGFSLGVVRGGPGFNCAAAMSDKCTEHRNE